jgi:dCMP deaminase
VIHAEMNARSFVRNRNDLKGSKAYITHAPCGNCLKHLIQDGVKEFIYDDESLTARFSDEMKQAIEIMIKANDITVRKYGSI